MVGVVTILKYMYDDTRRIIPKYVEPAFLIENWYMTYKAYKVVEDEYYV